MRRIVLLAASALAIASPCLAQDDWKLEFGLDLTYSIGRDVRFDENRSYFMHNMPNFTGFDDSYGLPPGEYNAGYVRPGIDPESGLTENWGADFENPGALRLDTGHISLLRTSYTKAGQEWNFTNVHSGSDRDSADSVMPMLRLTGWAPQKADSNFRWGVTGGFGWSPIDAENSYRAFDFRGLTYIDYTDQWDTFEIGSGADLIPDDAYYGDPGSSGPTLVFNPVSSTTEYWSDHYSATGWSDVEQEFEADLFTFRLGLAASWEWPVNQNDRFRLGLEGGPTLTVAHGEYTFRETIYADIHAPNLSKASYSDAESDTDVLFGAYLQGRAAYQFGNNFSLGVTGGYSFQEDWSVGEAELGGGNWFVGAFASWRF